MSDGRCTGSWSNQERRERERLGAAETIVAAVLRATDLGLKNDSGYRGAVEQVADALDHYIARSAQGWVR